MAFAGVRSDGESVVYDNKKDKRPDSALVKLDAFGTSVEFVLGHNAIEFDLLHLEAVKPDLKLLKKPVIDTLWLNPLAFPRNPYHHLVKHYQDGRLQTGHVNDPKLDAELVLKVLANQIQALAKMNKENPAATCACHYLTTQEQTKAGFDAVFTLARGTSRPDSSEAQAAIRNLLTDEACIHQTEQVIRDVDDMGWPLAYALAWIQVSGGNSVMPPWVRHQFPKAGQLVRRLRDTSCTDPSCVWCQQHNNPKTLLKRWLGFDSFRQKPTGPDGSPLQEVIVTTALSKQSVLGILPTGTGKSLCYQLPALSQFEKTGALTVVISPLVALMADQVASMERQGIMSSTTINGTLSLPERQAALDKVRLGDVAILLIAPEQLRSPSVRSVLKQREVDYWVLDEVHCVSKWGRAFRPDYRYIPRYIKEEHPSSETPTPLICLTATAKPDVIRDIREHFQEKLGVALELMDGGAKRDNLSFEIVQTSQHAKQDDVATVLTDTLPASGASGAIVYCSTRSGAERIAEALVARGFDAAHYHAGLTPEEKKEVQTQFHDGTLRVVAATNAFGMGIDKPDIRLVVHADIPASLENYFQEAGRAGRDQDAAHCILLFSQDDIERQFGLSARNRLEKREISAILKALRQLGRRFRQEGQENKVVATSGEIVKEEKDAAFLRDSATDDTRVRTAISWLEEAELLIRDENHVRVFPSSLRVRSLEDAEQRINKAPDVTNVYRSKLKSLVKSLLNARPDKGISTDELAGMSGFSHAQIRKALHDLEALGIASNDTAITIFVHAGVGDSSRKRLQEVSNLETGLIGWLREYGNDLDTGDTSSLNLRVASQRLRDDGHTNVRPDIIDRLVHGIARDGRDEDEGKGSLRVRKIDREHLSLRLERSWHDLAKTAERRRKAAGVLLQALLDRVPKQTKGKDIQVETTLGKLTHALSSDIELKARPRMLSNSCTGRSCGCMNKRLSIWAKG